MHNELLIIGIIVSLVFYECTGLVPGGIIVGGYLALHVGEPARIVYTLCIALGAYGIMELLGKWLIIYGRRRFALCIVTAYLLHLGVSALPFLPAPYTDMIGMLIPGIIAKEMGRQGILKTLLAIVVVVGALVLVNMLLKSL